MDGTLMTVKDTEEGEGKGEERGEGGGWDGGKEAHTHEFLVLLRILYPRDSPCRLQQLEDSCLYPAHLTLQISLGLLERYVRENHTL